MYDLHIHSTASDGVLDCEELIDVAISLGLKGIAITDHDTVNSLQRAKDYINRINSSLKFIPGIEINTDYENEEVHILGYFLDYKNEEFLAKLTELKEARYNRAIKMLDKLKNMGITLNLAAVEKIAQGDIIARPHIGQALVDKGYVFSVKEAFEKYLAKGRPAYVPRTKFTPAEAIRLINNVGGIAILAHPGLIRDGTVIYDVIDMGIEGIEVYYPEHSFLQIDYYLKICQEKNLLITGGSDFHGIGHEDSRNRIGCAGIEEEDYKCLLAYYFNKNNK